MTSDSYLTSIASLREMAASGALPPDRQAAVEAAILSREAASQPPTEADTHAMAEIIWRTSRADEGTISAMGANIIANTLLSYGYRLVPPVPLEVQELEEEAFHCRRCGADRYVGWRAGPASEGYLRSAQCLPCGYIQALPRGASQ